MPALDLRAQLELGSPPAEIHDRARHVWVADLVLADGVPMGNSQDLSDVVSVDKVVYEDSPRHEKQPTPAAVRRPHP